MTVATLPVQAPAQSYCPAPLLSAFALLMAGRGRVISTSMMLGDRRYAMEQLVHAHAEEDDELRSLAVRLFNWFEPARC